MNINKLLSSLILLMIISTNVFGQNDSIKSSRIQIGFVPHYLIFKGMRIDFEYKIKSGKQHIQLSPLLYYNESNISYDNSVSSVNNNNDYDKLIGIGVGLQHKIFLYRIDNESFGFYFAYGGEYAKFNFDYKKYDWTTVSENGFTYYKYRLISVKESINRIKADMHIGIQLTAGNVVFFDFYFGMGAAYSIVNTEPEIDTPKFKGGIFEYGYTGFYIPMGFRLGVVF